MVFQPVAGTRGASNDFGRATIQPSHEHAPLPSFVLSGTTRTRAATVSRIIAVAFGVACMSSAGTGRTYSSSSADAPRAALRVEPETVLIDQPPRITAVGLRPGQAVTITAQIRMSPYRLFAQATFLASAHGVVALDRDAPQSGSYSGVDPTGLLWSMLPDSTLADRGVSGAPALEDLPEFKPPAPVVIGLELRADGRTIAVARVTQEFRAPGVRRVVLREDGLVGTLFLPPTGRRPSSAILVLGGSEGGQSTERAMLLAAHGHAALALAYFRDEGLPSHLADIPLEYFGRALKWLRAQPDVQGAPLAVLGASRGAEAALLIAATFPEVRAVVAYAPSSIAWSGIPANGGSGRVSAWTFRGEPVSFAAGKRTLDDQDSVAKYAIQVERVRGPILLLAGADDQLWPSARMAQMVHERFQRLQHSYASTVLVYPEAGHAIAFPYLTVAPRLSLGGTVIGTANADRESWRAVLAFLREHVSRE
jgi:dienelactone hydrolase